MIVIINPASIAKDLADLFLMDKDVFKINTPAIVRTKDKKVWFVKKLRKLKDFTTLINKESNPRNNTNNPKVNT